MTEVLAAGAWRNNAEMIADVARLGYLDGTVLDVTYGKEGGFWKVSRPEALVTSDLYAPADHRWDYRTLPCDDNAFDVVVFDPPYKLNGTPATGEQDERFGTTKRTTRAEVFTDIGLGFVECYRVAHKRVLVKCMDQCEGGRVRWQTDYITDLTRALGGRKVDRFDIGVAGRKQDPKRKQRTARRKHSQLLVIAKPKWAKSLSVTATAAVNAEVERIIQGGGK